MKVLGLRVIMLTCGWDRMQTHSARNPLARRLILPFVRPMSPCALQSATALIGNSAYSTPLLVMNRFRHPIILTTHAHTDSPLSRPLIRAFWLCTKSTIWSAFRLVLPIQSDRRLTIAPFHLLVVMLPTNPI